MTTSVLEFKSFPKIARLSREVVVTEKLDGTNASVCIRPAGEHTLATEYGPFESGYDILTHINDVPHLIRAGSKNRWLRHDGKEDNFGFGNWVYQNAHELSALGPGTHHGEWWGKGIQRGYGLNEKRFSLFNTAKWSDFHIWCSELDSGSELYDGTTIAPMCCHVVPILFTGLFDTYDIGLSLLRLKASGSIAAPGFMDPEGVVIYHTQGNFMLKKTLEKDITGKEQNR